MKRDPIYLKEKFETNDTPEQEDFSDWMDSYWHKDEKIPVDNLNIDMSSKADKTAANLSMENIVSWKAKLNEPSQITITTGTNITTVTTDVNGLKMYGKNIILNNGSNNIDFTCLSTSEADFYCMITKAGTGSITFKTTGGTTIEKIDYTDVLNGGIGSTASIIRIGNIFYLRIYNA